MGKQLNSTTMDAEILIPISAFAMTFGIMYLFFSTRNRERLALIEKGADANIFSSNQGRSFNSLRFGLLMVGLALGLFIGNVLATTTPLDEDAMIFSMMFLFGGGALLASFAIERKLRKQDEEEQAARDAELARSQKVPADLL